MNAESPVPAARRAWQWSLIAAVLATSAAIIDITLSPTPRHVVMNSGVPVITWLSAAMQRRALKAALSTPPANER